MKKRKIPCNKEVYTEYFYEHAPILCVVLENHYRNSTHLELENRFKNNSPTRKLEPEHRIEWDKNYCSKLTEMLNEISDHTD